MSAFRLFLLISFIIGTIHPVDGEEETPTPSVFLTEFKSETYRGRIVLLNFWATYCAPCREEFPALIKLRNRFAEDQVVILGISVDRGKPDSVRDKLEPFIKRYHINYPIILDPKLDLVKAFGGFNEVPTTILMDGKGQVVRTYKGIQDFATLAGEIQSLFDGS